MNEGRISSVLYVMSCHKFTTMGKLTMGCGYELYLGNYDLRRLTFTSYRAPGFDTG
jgi:hypothetical protein